MLERARLGPPNSAVAGSGSEGSGACIAKWADQEDATVFMRHEPKLGIEPERRSVVAARFDLD